MSPDSVRSVLSTWGNSQTIAIDTETNGQEIRDGRGFAMGISMSNGQEALYLPFRHPDGENNLSIPEFRPIVQGILDTRRIVFHNAKFDLVSLATLGFNAFDSQFFDTMLEAHLVNEEYPQNKGLDYTAKYYLGNEGKIKDKDFKDILKLLGWGGLPVEDINEYAATDAQLTWDLHQALVPMLKEEDLLKTWEHKRKFIKLVIEMEKRGVRIDTDFCNEMAATGHRRMKEIEAELGINPGSPHGLKALLIDRLGMEPIMKQRKRKSGLVEYTMTFDKDAMEVYDIRLERIKSPVAKMILEYRGWQKSVSSNYEPYVELLSPDGRLRPNYKLHGTRTGRMSCEKPNLQQIPKSKGKNAWNGRMKAAFIPQDGYTLMEFDYSQLELRLGSFYAKEETLLQIFSDGEIDIFDFMSEDLGMTRDDTKTLVYSMQYGAGIQRLMDAFGVSRSRATEIRSNYFRTYPKFREITQQATAIVDAHGKIPIWSGRFRHFPDRRHSYKAFNSVIQGGGADIVERTMLRLADRGYNCDECRLLLQVHDSCIFEIRNDLVQELAPKISQVMIDVPAPFDNLRFAADGKVWGGETARAA